MTTSNERRSATIIPFPARRRAMADGHRDDMQTVGRHGAQHYTLVACGGAWYHEAAMAEEAERSGDN